MARVRRFELAERICADFETTCAPVAFCENGPEAQYVPYVLQTQPGCNHLIFQDASSVVSIALHIMGCDHLLQLVEPEADMVVHYGHRGRPVFYQVYGAWGVPNVRLWPIPDDRYTIQVMARYDRQSAHASNNPQDRAWTLLETWLTSDQRASLDAQRAFTVIGSVSNKRYRINSGNVFNVQELDDKNRPVRQLCFVPDKAAPYVGDVMLAQKIMLETDEPRALEIANKQAAPRLMSEA